MHAHPFRCLPREARRKQHMQMCDVVTERGWSQPPSEFPAMFQIPLPLPPVSIWSACHPACCLCICQSRHLHYGFCYTVWQWYLKGMASGPPFRVLLTCLFLDCTCVPWVTILLLSCFYCVSTISQFLLACAQGHCIQKRWHLGWPSHLCQCHHQCLSLPNVVLMLPFQSLEKDKNEAACGTLQNLLSFLSYCSFSVSCLLKASWEFPSFLFLLEGVHRVAY